MKVIVKRKGTQIEAAIKSESFFGQKDPQDALSRVKEWEKKYTEVIQKGRLLSRATGKSKNDLSLRWDLGNLLTTFLNRESEFELENYQQSMARDLELPSTTKPRFQSSVEIDALLDLLKTFPDKNKIDSRITWNLFYLTHGMMASNWLIRGKTRLSDKPMINELLDLANHQANLGIIGNGSAKRAAKRIIDILMEHGRRTGGL